MKKYYVLDTNALLEDPNCIRILRNGEENHIGIPFHVILELDRLKKDPRLMHLVAAAVESIHQNMDIIKILKDGNGSTFPENTDLQILKEVKHVGADEPILVTNDRIFQIIAGVNGVKSQEFKSSHPFQSESQLFTGFMARGTRSSPTRSSGSRAGPCSMAPTEPNPSITNTRSGRSSREAFIKTWPSNLC